MRASGGRHFALRGVQPLSLLVARRGLAGGRPDRPLAGVPYLWSTAAKRPAGVWSPHAIVAALIATVRSLRVSAPGGPAGWTAVPCLTLLVGVFVGGLGCAPSLATMQPAHVAPVGHLQATVGVEVGVPSGTLAKLVDTGQTLADQARTRSLSDAEIAQLFDTGVAVLASPPSVGQHFALAYTAFDRTEVQLRYSGGGWRLGMRYQLWRHEESPCDLVVGLGVGRATTSIPISDVVSFIEAHDFERWTFDLPLLVGTSRSWFRVWAGPRFLYTRFEAGLSISLPMNSAAYGALNGHARYLGGQGGIAFGYRYVFLGVELTIAEIFGSATMRTNLATVPRSTNIEGMVVYPAIALMGEF